MSSPNWSETLAQLESPTEVELAQIQRRFQESFEKKSDSQFSFRFQPSDPDFPHVFEKGLLLSIELPEKYPEVGCTVTVHNPTHEVFDEVKKTISEACSLYCTKNLGEPMIRKMLRWLDRNLEQLIDIGLERKAQKVETSHLVQISKEKPSYFNRRQRQEMEDSQQYSSKTYHENPQVLEDEEKIEGDWSASQHRSLELSLARYPSSLPPKERWTKIANDVGKSKKECLERVKALQRALNARKQETQRESEGGEAGGGEADGVEANVAARGTQVKLEGLALEQITIIKIPILKAQISCDRCSTVMDMTFQTKKLKQHLCSKCSSEVIVRFRSEMVHMRKTTIGYVDTQNCSVHDILPTDVLASCEECSCEHRFHRYVRGLLMSASCRECHQKISLKIEGFTLTKLKQGEDLSKHKKPLKRSKKQRQIFRVGEPLPGQGGCKHYTKSKRWMRFPCCGKVYACDKCHDEDVETQSGDRKHILKWANRMICGRCSKEQPFSPDPCINCGLNFTPRTTSHWEGGTGMRNKQKMSRGDKKKYLGGDKTVSKKAQRKEANKNRK